MQGGDVVVILAAEEDQRGGVEPEEVGIQSKCGDDMDGEGRHQHIEIRAEEVIEGLCQTFFGESGEIEIGFAHNGGHVELSEAIGHAPEIVMTGIHGAHNDGHAIAGGNDTTWMLGQCAIDDVEDSGAAEHVDDEWEVAKSLGNSDGDVHGTSIQYSSNRPYWNFHC
jgi:hypothetical protein